jgi:hypothetical protein
LPKYSPKPQFWNDCLNELQRGESIAKLCQTFRNSISGSCPLQWHLRGSARINSVQCETSGEQPRECQNHYFRHAFEFFPFHFGLILLSLMETHLSSDGSREPAFFPLTMVA